MEVTAQGIKNQARTMFPNLRTFDVMDRVFDPLDRGQTAKLTRQFYWQLTAIGLGKWTKNKRDCDKAARLCVAYVIVRQALSRADNAKAFGTVSYLRNGDPEDAHMVNLSVERSGVGTQMITSEPEGGKGPFKMTRAERESVWRFSM